MVDDVKFIQISEVALFETKLKICNIAYVFIVCKIVVPIPPELALVDVKFQKNQQQIPHGVIFVHHLLLLLLGILSSYLLYLFICIYPYKNLGRKYKKQTK